MGFSRPVMLTVGLAALVGIQQLRSCSEHHAQREAYHARQMRIYDMHEIARSGLANMALQDSVLAEAHRLELMNCDEYMHGRLDGPFYNPIWNTPEETPCTYVMGDRALGQ